MSDHDTEKARFYLNRIAHLAGNISKIAPDMSPEVWKVVNDDLADAVAQLEGIECMFNPDGQEID